MNEDYEFIVITTKSKYINLLFTFYLEHEHILRKVIFLVYVEYDDFYCRST